MRAPGDAQLTDTQLNALLHEYDALRRELAGLNASTATVGGLLITVAAIAWGFVAETGR